MDLRPYQNTILTAIPSVEEVLKCLTLVCLEAPSAL